MKNIFNTLGLILILIWAIGFSINLVSNELKLRKNCINNDNFIASFIVCPDDKPNLHKVFNAALWPVKLISIADFIEIDYSSEYEKIIKNTDLNDQYQNDFENFLAKEMLAPMLRNPTLAENNLLRLARDGDPIAQYTYAVYLSEVKGNDLEVIKEATKWLQVSAKSGYPPALHHLGVIYLFEKKYKKAHDYFLEASLQNYSESIYQLAGLIENGNGIKQNFNTAFMLYLKASLNGHEASQLKMTELQKKLK
ncbi:tetratricopeptide repeat protein [Thiomicrospira sp. ALE5]|uniref:tetratricopeptide repeat protein n=1 Tax=Thiomicrospira sp. ALE5 TaxID=748650 RepID=UPI0008E8E041|nr:tetratricopeptide repeat protein [Thiomicrospira sp. ALE5]SFR54967.1 hypothetical protein SAMN03092900_1078 [Thiomicrospira sp. ALE5]